MASKKITELTASPSVSGDDLLIVVDMAGPTTVKVTVANFFSSVAANANFTANVSVNGTFTANTATLSGNVSSTKHLISNNLIVTKNTTPANSTHAVVGTERGLIWTDGDYVYAQANATHYKRAALATW
jgi:hypothetical protein